MTKRCKTIPSRPPVPQRPPPHTPTNKIRALPWRPADNTISTGHSQDRLSFWPTGQAAVMRGDCGDSGDRGGERHPFIHHVTPPGAGGRASLETTLFARDRVPRVHAFTNPDLLFLSSIRSRLRWSETRKKKSGSGEGETGKEGRRKIEWNTENEQLSGGECNLPSLFKNLMECNSFLMTKKIYYPSSG